MGIWTQQKVTLQATVNSGAGTISHPFVKLCEVPEGDWYFQWRVAPANRADWYYYCVAVCERLPEADAAGAPGEFQSVQLYDGYRWGTAFVRGPAYVLVAHSNADLSLQTGPPDVVRSKTAGLNPTFLWRITNAMERPPFTSERRYYYMTYLDAFAGLPGIWTIEPILSHNVAIDGVTPTTFANMNVWTYGRVKGVYLHWRTAPGGASSIWLSPLSLRRATGPTEVVNDKSAADPAAWAVPFRGSVVEWPSTGSPPDLQAPTRYNLFNPAGQPACIVACWLMEDPEV